MFPHVLGSMLHDAHAVGLIRALLIRCWAELKWRHHGIGLLQAYLAEGPGIDPEVRCHIWHPELVRPGIRESGSIHDHRFDLVSTIVEGSIRDRAYHLVEDAQGPWSVWHVENARSAGEHKNYDGECHPLQTSRFKAGTTERVYHVGDTYTMERANFHETLIESPIAVTLCSLYGKTGSARLLVPHGREPVHAFGQDPDAPLIRSVLEHAHAALTRV